MNEYEVKGEGERRPGKRVIRNMYRFWKKRKKERIKKKERNGKDTEK